MITPHDKQPYPDQDMLDPGVDQARLTATASAQGLRGKYNSEHLENLILTQEVSRHDHSQRQTYELTGVISAARKI